MRPIKLLLIILSFSLSSIYAFVHASGDSIVDADGNVVLQKGMGLGGWLLPEGYMLQVPGFGSPTAIREMIVDLVGEAVADTFYQRYHDNYVTREDILQLGEWGFDHIRMPFHYKMFSPYRGVWDEWGFAVTDSLLDWCEAAGMHLVLDMHGAPGGQNHGPISDSDGTARLWLADSNKAHAIEIWGELASRYANDTRIGGYDLLNEPVLPQGVGANELRALYMNMTQVIRAVDQNHIIFIEGNWYASDFTGLTPPWELNMAYSFHKYWSVNNQGSIQSYINMRNAYNVPLWMSESGENSNPWFYDCIQLLENNDIGWCWWTHKKVSTITSPYSAPMPPEFQELIDYWNGSAPRPSAAEATVAIMALAENLRTENCVYRPGVIPSMFDPNYGSSHWPVKELNIPGEIWVADYDIGDEGVAYADEDFEHDDFNDYHPWNTGYQYRNDGVDLQISDNGVPNLGWTEDGEWLKYTVQVNNSGLYSLLLEVASPSEGGIIRLYADEQLLTTITPIPSTGSWWDWDIVTAENLELLAGTHVLTLEIVQAGFNLRSMEFVLDSAYAGGSIPLGFELGASYPNPFNPLVTIPLEIHGDDKVSLRIMDISGRIIHNFEPIGEGPGSYLVSWDGRYPNGKPAPSGIYYYLADNGVEYWYSKMTLLK